MKNETKATRNCPNVSGRLRWLNLFLLHRRIPVEFLSRNRIVPSETLIQSNIIFTRSVLKGMH